MTTTTKTKTKKTKTNKPYKFNLSAKRTEDNLPDFYMLKYRQVRYSDGTPITGRKPDWRFGIQDKYGDESKEAWIKEASLIIDDAVTGIPYKIPLFMVDVVKIDFGQFGSDWGSGPMNEYDAFIEKEFKKAQKVSDKAGKGLKVGKLFSVGVADGMAWYIVTRVNKKTVRVEWRGFGADRYVDQILGYEGTFPKHSIEHNISFNDWRNGAFR